MYMTVWNQSCILIDSLKPDLYFNMTASSPAQYPHLRSQAHPVFQYAGLKSIPIFECEYEASALNQGPNQVHGTETSTMNTMNRGLLVTKNYLAPFPRYGELLVENCIFSISPLI